MILAVDEAVLEVTTKSDLQLEKETAFKWAARAAACFQLYAESEDVKWLVRGDGYRHEALEHAALACAEGEVVKEVAQAIDGFVGELAKERSR